MHHQRKIDSGDVIKGGAFITCHQFELCRTRAPLHERYKLGWFPLVKKEVSKSNTSKSWGPTLCGWCNFYKLPLSIGWVLWKQHNSFSQGKKSYWLAESLEYISRIFTFANSTCTDKLCSVFMFGTQKEKRLIPKLKGAWTIDLVYDPWAVHGVDAHSIGCPDLVSSQPPLKTRWFPEFWG